MRYIVLAILLNSCMSIGQLKDNKNPIWKPPASNYKNLKKAYFASGCFWCVEAVFESVKGVYEVYSGYSGGYLKNPTYTQIGTGRTGHAEAVEVLYNDEEIGYGTLLQVFFGSHDPTTLNRQGPDIGTQYRSEIFFTNNYQKEIAEKIKSRFNLKYNGKIITKISGEKNYCKAEEYHQKYIQKRN